MRQEFSKATKLLAFHNCRGRCQQCDAKLSTGNVEFHHDVECTMGGSAEIGNCVVLCRTCHSAITRQRATIIAKSNRVRANHLGIKRKRLSFQTNRDGKYKRKMDGSVVLRAISD